MGSLLLSLVPFAVGAALTPLAIIAVVVVLLSRHARANGPAFLVGWAGAVVVILLVGRWLAALLDVGPHRTPPDWVAYVRLVIGLVLVVSAAWIWRRADRHVQQMAAARGPAEVVAAAPQLPGLLRSVETFRPLRCLLLGAALVLTSTRWTWPASSERRWRSAWPTSRRPEPSSPVCCSSPAARRRWGFPVALYLARPHAAQRPLEAVRNWIAGNTRTLNAGLLLLIGLLQIVKGVMAL